MKEHWYTVERLDRSRNGAPPHFVPEVHRTMILTDGIHLMVSADCPIDDLHAFAAKIGLKRASFQDHPEHPHYDLTTRHAYIRARRAGAISTRTRTMLDRCRRVPSVPSPCQSVPVRSALLRSSRDLFQALETVLAVARVIRRAAERLPDESHYDGHLEQRLCEDCRGAGMPCSLSSPMILGCLRIPDSSVAGPCPSDIETKPRRLCASIVPWVLAALGWAFAVVLLIAYLVEH